MYINLYKGDKELDMKSCLEKLREKEYNLINKIVKNRMVFVLFLKNKTHNPTDWKMMLNSNFDTSKYTSITSKNLLDSGDETRAVLLIKKYNSLFLLPYGLAFHDINELVDNDFGLSFAERALRESDIKTKSVDFFQDNKLKEIKNFKNKTSATIGATESFSLVSGEPIDNERYGNMINCGVGVKFSKSVEANNFFEIVSTLCENVLDLLKIKTKITLPRIIKYSKYSTFSKELNRELKKQIINKENDKVEVRELLDIGDKTYSIRDYSIQMRIKKSGVSSRTIDFFEIRSIRKFIIEMENEGVDFELDDVVVHCKNNMDNFEYQLNNFIFCDLLHNNDIFVLQSGFWGKYNKKYLEVLNETLDKIPINIDNSRILLLNSKNEEKYIAQKVKRPNFYMIHKKNMRPKRHKNIRRIGIELGDIYVENSGKGEVIAVKKGGNVKDTIYSLEQSILSLKIINNLNDFEVSEELESILGNEDRIKLIKKTKIAWIFLSDERDRQIYSNEQTKIDRILDNTISLKRDFNSLFLKNKLVEWYLLCQESSMMPEIIFEVPIYKKTFYQLSKVNGSHLIYRGTIVKN